MRLHPSGVPLRLSLSAPLPSFSHGSFCRGVLQHFLCPVVYSHGWGGVLFSSVLTLEAPLLLSTESLYVTMVPLFHLGGLVFSGVFPCAVGTTFSSPSGP